MCFALLSFSLVVAGTQLGSGDGFKPVGEVLNSLSDQAHAPVSIASALKEYRVDFERRGLSSDQSLDLLAKAFQCSVVLENGKAILKRTAADTRNLHDARTKQRAKWISDTLERLAKFRKSKLTSNDLTQPLEQALKAQLSMYDDYFRNRAYVPSEFPAFTLLPSETLQDSLLERLTPAELGSLPTDSSCVYEDLPIGTALPLPNHGDLISNYSEGAASLSSLKLDSNLIQKSNQYFHFPRSNRVPVLTRLAVFSKPTECETGLELFDDQGNLVDSTWFQAKSWDAPMTLVWSTRSVLDGYAKDSSAKWIELSPEAKQALAFCADPTIKTCPDWFIHPEQHEPLNLFVRQALEALEGQSGKPLLIVGADTLWDDCKSCVKNGWLSLDALRLVLRERSLYERLETPSCVIWRPQDPEAAEARQADRKVLGRFARNAISGGTVSLRTAGRLFYDCSPYPGALCANWNDIAAYLTEPNGYRGIAPTERFGLLIGAISDDNWSRLVSGRTYTATELGIEKELDQLLADEKTAVQSTAPISDLLRYATEAQRYTPLGQMQVSVQAIDGPQLSFSSPGGKLSDSWADPARLNLVVRISPTRVVPSKTDGSLTVGMTEAEFEREQDAAWNWRMAEKMGTVVRIQLAQNAFLESSREVTGVNPSDVMKFSDLPNAIKRSFWESACKVAIEQAKQVH